MNDLTLVTPLAEIKGAPFFRWQTQDGLRLKPIDMDTRHLYMTVRMLWNHTMPVEFKLGPYHRYQLGDRFTEEYIKLSFRVLMSELVTRPDIEDAWMHGIAHMVRCLNQNPTIPMQLRLENEPE